MTASTTTSTTSPISTTRQRQDLAIDTLRSMTQQESGAYRIPTKHLEAILNVASSSSSSPPSQSALVEGEEQQQQQPQHHQQQLLPVAINQAELSAYLIWRRQMIEWCYRIAETCKFAKETVEISTSLLDRYVATCPSIMLDAATYQLSCMACLYTACKTNEPTCLSPQQMERISGCRFDNQALQHTEVRILNALRWRVNPPTAIAFGRCLLDAVDLGKDFGIASAEQKDAVLSAVEIQIEQATADELFLPIRASGIALAAVLNGVRCHLPPSEMWRLETTLSQALGFGQTKTAYQRHQKVEKLQNALLALVALSHGYELCPPMMMEEADHHETNQGDCSMQQQHQDDDESMGQKPKSAMDSDYFRPYSPRSVLVDKQ